MIISIHKKVSMWLLALYPILYYYSSPLSVLSYIDIVIILYSIPVIINKNNQLFFPKYYLLLWGYLAIDLILVSNPFKVSYLIPGGFSFFIWSIYLLVFKSTFDMMYFRKTIKKIFNICFVIFVIQELMFYIKGYRIPALLPITSSFYDYGEVSYQQLFQFQKYASRSSALFMEPAYFAEYCLIYLTIELFSRDCLDKYFNKTSLYIVLLLIFLRSGVGLVGTAFLIGTKLIYILRKRKTIKKLWYIVVVVPIVLSVAYIYVNSKMGQQMISRTEEFSGENQEKSGYIRTIRGFVIFNEMDAFNKVFGVSELDGTRQSPTYRNALNDNKGFVLNGIQTILVKHGIIGVILFFIVFCHIYISSSEIGKHCLLLMLLISFGESVFLMPFMLLSTVIACKSKLDYNVI